MRFYPDCIPPFPHEPLHADFAISYFSEQIGEGIVSLKPFRVGNIVFAFSGTILSEVTQYTLQLKSGLHIHDPYFMGKILHHCAPNCRVDLENRFFIAIKPIDPGDLVTMDYESTEDILFKPFQCNCGAENCRGYIAGVLATQSVMQRS